MKNTNEKQIKRLRRKMHIRKKIRGTAERPRICVNRTNKHIYVQVIDDQNQQTIAAVNTCQKDNRELKMNVKNALKIGEILGKKLKELKVSNVVFDRNGFKYHGIVKAVADGVRKSGLSF